MAKRIGFMCDLKLPRLNQAADFVSENLPEEELKKQLDKYLSFEIKSEINIRKTREIFLNIWYYETEYSPLLHPCAMLLYKKFRDEALPIQGIDTFLVCAAASVGTQNFYSCQEINDMDTLFPFEYRVSKERLLKDDRFVVSNWGWELAVSIKAI